MADMLDQLEAVIADRRQHPREDSYTTRLFSDGRPRIAQKVGEEATEVIVAALSQTQAAQVGELADLFYHTLVLMAELGISLEAVRTELARRHQLKTTEQES